MAHSLAHLDVEIQQYWRDQCILRFNKGQADVDRVMTELASELDDAIGPKRCETAFRRLVAAAEQDGGI